MINKALRPAHQRSEQLKRISHHFMSDARDSSTDEQNQHNSTETAAVFPGKAADAPVSPVDTPADKAPAEGVNTAKTDKNAGLKKANKAAKAGKEKKSRKHHKEGKTGKEEKSRKHDKAVKAGRGKKSRKKDKKIKTAADKPEKPGETGNKMAAVQPVVAASGSIAAAQANSAKAQPIRLEQIPGLSGVTVADTTPLPDTVPAKHTSQQDTEQKTGRKTEPSPSAQDLNLAAATSARHVSLYMILGVSLMALYGLWGYHYWRAEHDLSEAKATRTVVATPQPQEIQPEATVPDERKAALSIAQVPPVTHITQADVAAKSERLPEQPATDPQTRNSIAPYPRPQFRPPVYDRSARRPAWRPPPYYRNYPQPRYRHPPPSPFFRDQRTVAKVIR